MLEKIFSGGQTGVDQGAFNSAIKLGLPTGGYCPRGRLCENGIIPKKYKLTETAESDYSVRTRLNIIHSDGTLILNPDSALEGGTLLTKKLAKKYHKPCFILLLDELLEPGFHDWLKKNKIKILNIAGPRESKYPGIQKKSALLLEKLLIQ